MEEKHEKNQEVEFKGNLGFIWLIGILVILLGCVTVYTLKLTSENNELKQAPQTVQQLAVATQEQAKTENTNSIIPDENTVNLSSSDKEKYTDKLTDAKNGKTAFLELEKNGEFKTEKHNGYYTYIDPFNKKYNIKEIKNVVSEKGTMGNDDWAALFKVTVTYINNNNKTKTMELAIILQSNHEVQCRGTFDNYTGTTSFVRAFTDLYGNIEETDSIEESSSTTKINGTYKSESETKNYYYSSQLIISNQTNNSIDFSISAVHGHDVDHVNIGEISGTANRIDIPKDFVAPDSIQYAYQFVDTIDNKTNKITIVYTHFKKFEFVDIIEEYADDRNPYAGAGVYFEGDYERIK